MILYSRFRRRRLAFTIVELLVVVAIIALLAGLMLPNVSSVIRKSQSIKCAANLQAIGIALSQAATDNNNVYPEIEQGPPSVPIYPANSGATNIVGALGAYGITTDTLKCPTDLQQNPSSFKLYGASYQWAPIYDDSETTAALVVINNFIQIPLNSARVRLCTDCNPIHGGKGGHTAMNALYGDGHVVPR